MIFFHSVRFFQWKCNRKFYADDIGNRLTTNKCEDDKMKFKKIRKRDGRIEESKVEKITNAMAKMSVA